MLASWNVPVTLLKKIYALPEISVPVAVTVPVALLTDPVTVSPTWKGPLVIVLSILSLVLVTTVTVFVEVGVFLRVALTKAVSVYPEPPLVIVPVNPGMRKVAVADIPAPVVVNPTF